MIKLEQFNISNQNFIDYMPLGWKAIWSALQKIPLEKSQCTFLDYGCGKGRAFIAASVIPYRRVIGIDVSEILIAEAKKNCEIMRYRKAKSIELYNMDATQYIIPEDVNIIYFFNPFKGLTLKQTLK